MTDWVNVYHELPYCLKVAVASARGYHLTWWRTGPNREDLLQEAAERESWSSTQWNQWRSERLSYILHRAALHVPYYRNMWQARRRQGDYASWNVLENWPILTKETLRKQPTAFVADDSKRYHMYHEQTSGTTGKPVLLWHTRHGLRIRYAIHERRLRQWNGIEPDDTWAMMGGQLVTSFSKTKPPFWVWNSGMRQLYMSSYHLSPTNAPHYLEAMQRHRVSYMLGYASSMYALARSVLDSNLTAPTLKVAISNAEPLLAHQREAIEKAFSCPTRDTYGMTEYVAEASECRTGNMHVWPEVGVIEVMNERYAEPVPDGDIGRLVCTGLLNINMPLIRYDVGDRGALEKPDVACQCGRRLPLLRSIEGRTDDVIITPDGRTIGRLDAVFKADLPIREAQIIQEAIDKIRIRVVPASGYDNSHSESIVLRLRDRIGEMDVTVSVVDTIPRTANGKLRAVVSELDRESLARARGEN